MVILNKENKMSFYIACKNALGEYDNFCVPEEVFYYVSLLENHASGDPKSRLLKVYPEKFAKIIPPFASNEQIETARRRFGVPLNR